MDETDKLIIFVFSGATILIGCLVITCACIFTPNIKEKQDPETQNNNHETADITRVSMVVTQELINATKNNNIDLGKTENEQDTSNEKIDNIIQNFRESLTNDTEVLHNLKIEII